MGKWRAVLLVLTLLLPGCADAREAASPAPVPDTLSSLAYEYAGSAGCRVWVEEEGGVAPYLVLTCDYDGSGMCLLLREYLLPEARAYHMEGEKPSYYEGSGIDCYLNETFIASLPENVRNLLTEVSIEITKKDSIGKNGRETCRIQRKVFLLSFAELNVGGSRTNLAEGSALAYFDTKEARIAYYEDGTKGSWWLRTPNTSDRTIVCGVSTDGMVGIGGIYGGGEAYLNGVRPAFCISGNAAISYSTLHGERVCMLTG